VATFFILSYRDKNKLERCNRVNHLKFSIMDVHRQAVGTVFLHLHGDRFDDALSMRISGAWQNSRETVCYRLNGAYGGSKFDLCSNFHR
jgi:hypothetical protein